MLTADTMRFLIENRMNNSREFFTEHRADYEQHVLQPLASLVAELAPTMLAIDSEFIVEPKISKTISRIYRDTRFSKDKSLYRDVMWICFQRKRELYKGESSYFFEIAPNGFRWGLGWYEAGSEAMEIYRMLIDRNDPKFLKAYEMTCAQDRFGLEGDLYKRTRYRGTEEGIRSWYDRKSVYLCRNSTDAELLFSDRLADTLKRDFESIKDVYYFFRELELYKDKQNSSR